MLRGAFTAEELSYLEQHHTEFRHAAAAMRSIRDFEAVCKMGNKLLMDREHARKANQSQPK
jgi:hypothetical protein